MCGVWGVGCGVNTRMCLFTACNGCPDPAADPRFESGAERVRSQPYCRVQPAANTRARQPVVAQRPITHGKTPA